MTRRTLKSIDELRPDGKKKRKDGTQQKRLSKKQKEEKLARGVKATGRPTIYGGDVWEEILLRLSDGETLTAICLSDHLPSRRQVLFKVSKDKDFGHAYTRARLMAADLEFDAITDTVKNHRLGVKDQVELGRLKLLIDTMKWKLSHVNPRKYADKIDVSADEGRRPTRVMIVGSDFEEPSE